jgi:cytochrome b561
MTGLVAGMDRFDLTQQHKSFGFVVFVLACIRVAWRWISPAVPGLSYETPGWQRFAVHTTHYGMYVLMFLLPLSGWLMASASPFNDPDAYIYIPNVVFGLFELPDPISPGDKDLTEIFGVIHRYAGDALAALLAMHIGGVLFHHFILRDSVLTRMLPFGRDRSAS